MMYVLCGITLLPFVFGAVYFDAPCPNIEPVENFNLSAYATGDWYQVARYPNDFVRKGECLKFSYSNENGKPYLTETEEVEDKRVIFTGYTDYAPDAGGKGALHIISSITQDIKLPVYVLDADYDQYTVIFECNYDEAKKRRNDYAWLVSRSPQLTGEAKAKVDKFLKGTSLINPDLLVWNDPDKEHCKF